MGGPFSSSDSMGGGGFSLGSVGNSTSGTGGGAGDRRKKLKATRKPG